jgi:hypothetical protein
MLNPRIHVIRTLYNLHDRQSNAPSQYIIQHTVWPHYGTDEWLVMRGETSMDVADSFEHAIRLASAMEGN